MERPSPPRGIMRKSGDFGTLIPFTSMIPRRKRSMVWSVPNQKMMTETINPKISFVKSTYLRVFVGSREITVSILICPPSLRSHAAARKVNHNRAYSVNLKNGFARVRCAECGNEYLLAFSCKRRHFCPSCHQKRVVEFGEWG